MAEFASKGVAGAGLGLGIAGTALALLKGGGGLAGILGGGNANCYNKYDAEKDGIISELRSQLALRDANTYGDQKLLEVYKYVDGKIEGINGKLCEQAVWNATQTSAITCMAQQIAALNGLTKIVIPNTSVCPGWGNVNVAPATTTGA